MIRKALRGLSMWVVCVLCAQSASATFSIVIADEDTGEVALGVVTCLEDLDLMELVPVVVVGKGAGVAQAFNDDGGVRRAIMFDGLLAGAEPDDILALLADVPGHDFRQYGIADSGGGAATFTGIFNDDWAGGMIGTHGALTYAIQGNVLAGECVLIAMEDAVISSASDMPSRLMAAMQAARDAGGDGRCSCSVGSPTACGCPPQFYDKVGHIGGMVVARIGDTDDELCDVDGCADGDYFLRFNVAFQDSGDCDPVEQLQSQFDGWRADHIGRPDAVHSSVVFDPPVIPPNGLSTTFMDIALLDWRDLPIKAALTDIVVMHALDSDGLSSIDLVVDNGDGTVRVTLTSGTATGIDRFRVSVNDGFRAVTLTPDPLFEYFRLGDIDGNGVVTTGDLLAILVGWGKCPPVEACPADLDGDGMVGFSDIRIVLQNWG